MIPQHQERVLDAGLASLALYGRKAGVRGRFVALYLGLRRMRTRIARLGTSESTPQSDVERFLDDMFTKTHRPDPFIVLTAPFGGSRSPSAPYSSRTGVQAPGHRFPTNTWRNNFGIQKGVGCPAEPAIIESLLHDPTIRLACPHMRNDPSGQHICSLENTDYRGEEHSIWLRRAGDGYQVVDLDLPYVYESYLTPGASRIPIFALIAVLYSFAGDRVYPARNAVGIPDFADDFYFSLKQVADIFDTDPESEGNATVLEAVETESARMFTPPADPSRTPQQPSTAPMEAQSIAGEMPPEADPIEMNTGIGAERLVAKELARHGWEVAYRGNQMRIGYDLEARRQDQALRVEVKSSVSFTIPRLTESEWTAAIWHGEDYVLAIVDFYGSDRRRIWYVRNPAGMATPTAQSMSLFRLARSSIEPLATGAEFL